MPKLTGPFEFKGKLGNIQAYPLQGVEGTMVRQVGGPSSEQVKNGDNFENTRKNNKEWDACAKGSRALRFTFMKIRRFITDYQIAGSLTSFSKFVLERDPVGEWGERSVYFSANKSLLEGFNLNKKANFNSVIQTPVSFTVDRENKSATLNLPELVYGLNFKPYWKHPYCRFIINLGSVSDIEYNNGHYFPASPDKQDLINDLRLEWFATETKSEAQTVTIDLNNLVELKPGQTLVLSVGMEVGKPTWGGELMPVKYQGVGMILKLF